MIILKKILLVFFFPNDITHFLSFYRIIKEKGNLYPFAILNTNRNTKPGRHRWNILNIHPSKQLSLFDSYDLTGFKCFIIDGNKNIINRILCGINKFNKKDDISTLISVKVSVDAYQNLNSSELTKLNTIVADLLHLIKEFGKLHNIRNEIVLYLVDDQLQELTSDTCGIFQLYFYKNLFDPLAKTKSQIINDNKLTRNTISKLLNEPFLLDREENESMVEKFAEQYDITRSWNVKACPNSNSLDLFKIVDFWQSLMFLLLFKLIRN